MKTPNELIEVKLVLPPSIALMIGTYLHQTVQGNMEWHNMLSEDGKKDVMKFGQDIVDQVAEKGFNPEATLKKNPKLEERRKKIPQQVKGKVEQTAKEQEEKEDNAPQIIKDLIEFLKAYHNPDDLPEDREASPIKVYMLNCYSISYNFIFKWIIKRKEMNEILEWNKEFKLENDVLKLYLNEDKIELQATDNDEETELGC